MNYKQVSIMPERADVCLVLGSSLRVTPAAAYSSNVLVQKAWSKISYWKFTINSIGKH